MQVKGRYNIPRKAPFILAANHLSNIDPVVLAAACPRMLNFLAKAELFEVPFFGSLIRALRAFPVKRNKADIGALKEGLKRLKKQALLVFPEGTRAKDAKKAYGGVGFLALKSGVRVIPAKVYDTDKVLGPGSKFPKPHRITVTFGKPLKFDKKEKPLEIARRIIAAINALY